MGKIEKKFEKDCEIKKEEGCVETKNKEYNVKGSTTEIENKLYENNYINRYNDINVTNSKYVKNFVKDYNIIHHKTKKINLGTTYLGKVVIEKKCKKEEKKCKKHLKKECKMNKCEKKNFNWCKDEEKEYTNKCWCKCD